MAKKRRSRAQESSNAPPEYDASKSKLRTETWEDVADEIDHFQAEREKILLEKSGYEDDSDDLEASDEEVLALNLTSDESDSDSAEEYDEDEADQNGGDKRSSARVNDDSDDEEILGKAAADDSEEEGWGQNKKDYYGTNIVETEEDAKQEEAEARKIQTTKLSSMKETDFVFDEDEWAAAEESGSDDGSDKEAVVEELPAAALPEDSEARVKLLKARHPEFEPLSRDFLELQETYNALSHSAQAEEAIGDVGVATVKFRALSTYLGVLGLYFAVLTSDEAIATKGRSVREHGVMEGIVRARSAWEQARDLKEDTIGGSPQVTHQNGNMRLPESVPEAHKQPKAKSKVSKASKEAKKQKQSKDDGIHQRKSLLPERIVAVPSLTIPKLPSKTSEFTDEVDTSNNPLAASRRRALSFHATQLTSKSNKRRAAVVSGDSDIPHKERLKEKQERLRKEVERKRAEAEANAELGGGDSGSEGEGKKGKKRARDEDEEYYDMVANSGKKRKEERQALYADFKASEKAEIAALNADNVEDGKRKITYQIEKNKGLTPHRKKENRNPRVKKRMKYEKAKKKLSSTKAIYKPLKGSYGGELTGIKGGLVKSRKLG